LTCAQRPKGCPRHTKAAAGCGPGNAKRSKHAESQLTKSRAAPSAESGLKVELKRLRLRRLLPSEWYQKVSYGIEDEEEFTAMREIKSLETSTQLLLSPATK
jgi:hypothetical protein